MALLEPGSDTAALRSALQVLPADGCLVACFCAAWCDTCAQYRPKFAALAEQYPERVFVWIDIEDHPELLGDEDVENFPTLLVQFGSRVLFYGTMLPHIGHLERLLESLTPQSPAVQTQLPDLPTALLSV
ncbi:MULTISPECIES: thioredoxin family protein [unclassified Bordetella]|uniref:thioredoxin family protein n=1 Tax=unclassified Bordetella TaxID=2630031 RepID=UPI00132C0735|nr:MULTISPECIES: thioredoxin family protein [unclassified Bordetella]MVW73516.1 thioredoxin [Bordetella sp. 15P40C-2]MVW77449.1 thioredoxin [Bordetella sp. 02P26C-1]